MEEHRNHGNSRIANARFRHAAALLGRPSCQAAALATIIIALALLRFVDPTADLPRGITWSGTLYTDEGWYAHNAIAYFISGHWWIDGEHNLGFYTPVSPLLQGILFKLFGMSLAVARYVTIAAACGIAALAFRIVRGVAGTRTGLLAALLILANAPLFFYCRFAQLDVPLTFFVLLSLAILLCWREPLGKWAVVGSALAIGLAVLTKRSAISAAPLPIVILWLEKAPRARRVRDIGLFVGAGLLCAGAYWVLVLWPNWAEVSGTPGVLGDRANRTLLALARGMISAVRLGLADVDPFLFPLALVVGPLALLADGVIRRNVVLLTAVLWLGGYVALLGMSAYQPSRYFVPAVVPTMIVVALLVDALFKSARWSRLAAPALLLVAVSVCFNVVKIARYMTGREHSFMAAAQSVDRHFRDDKVDRPVILGTFGYTLGMAIGVQTISDLPGPFGLPYKIAKHQPTHLVSLGDHDPSSEVAEALRSSGYCLRLIDKYDVFGNYMNGRRLTLYRLLARGCTE